MRFQPIKDMSIANFIFGDLDDKIEFIILCCR